MIDIEGFIQRQLGMWPMAKRNFEALNGVKTRELGSVRIQFNPARIVSTGAKVDAASIKKRTCFLCESNRPSEQIGIVWGQYTILINPFPIFPRHLTIPDNSHVPQGIKGRMSDMCSLAKELPGYTVFYNGPKCGASAPDHMHFQAGNSDFLPNDIPHQIGHIEIVADSPDQANEEFEKVYEALPQIPGEEPMMNVLCEYKDGKFRVRVIPRKRHRPSFYGQEPGQLLVSPASVDLAGVLITPLERDFNGIAETDLDRIFGELCYSSEELKAAMMHGKSLKVGIMHGKDISMHLDGTFLLDGDEVSGNVELNARNVKFPLLFVPLHESCSVTLKDVTIGVNFHWQRQEDQTFKGRMLILPNDDELIAINILSVEDYLESVISSEMSATSQVELLKAHAVISRSWVLAQIRNRELGINSAEKLLESQPEDVIGNDGTLRRVRWYGGNDHTLFDVCADDHCQRYQGMTRQSTPEVAEAVRQTSGQVLMSDGELCDTRFSKCCGGAFEEYETCWENDHKPYLIGKRDSVDENDLPDLRDEAIASKWIKEEPKAFCNTNDREVLRQVLNGYDQETADFFRWKVEYDADALGELVAKRSGIEVGRILDLVPMQRGTSGRLQMLRIVGSKRTIEVGKELEIRRILSESHLYSSAFVPERTPNGFRLIGAGWGHGVGLCQIGAAMMASQGYGYKDILMHYYPNSNLVAIN